MIFPNHASQLIEPQSLEPLSLFPTRVLFGRSNASDTVNEVRQLDLVDELFQTVDPCLAVALLLEFLFSFAGIEDPLDV
jgi:hypothetical protein